MIGYLLPGCAAIAIYWLTIAHDDQIPLVGSFLSPTNELAWFVVGIAIVVFGVFAMVASTGMAIYHLFQG